VTDSSGRFVTGLSLSDFAVYEDNTPVEITYFSAERVPVSLGIVLDTSGSMTGQKIAVARSALERLLFDLLGPEDEVFLYTFDNKPHLIEGWTNDRNSIRTKLQQVRPDGATALYDTVAEALPLMRSGRHAKKALLVISDGNDTSSRTSLTVLRQLIRESEALVYAIGMDASVSLAGGAAADAKWMPYHQRRPPIAIPLPIPGRRPPRTPPVPGMPPVTGWPPSPKPTPDEPDASRSPAPDDDRVNASVLREIADETGGRTEIVHDTGDLNPATRRIADELSRQYFLAYSSRGQRDGRWHTIRVELRDRSLKVRARRGYTAS
jgi:VWFA-related protein